MNKRELVEDKFRRLGLRDTTRIYMFENTSLFEESLDPKLSFTFGATRFPIDYKFTQTPKYRQGEILSYVLSDLRNIRSKLTIELCTEYNELFGNPQTPDGLCRKDETCKVLRPHKFACRGCGKVYVPDSYVSKNCNTNMTKPFWYPYLKDEMIYAVEQLGGKEIKDKPVFVTADGYQR